MSANDIDVEAFILDISMRPPIWNGSFGNKDDFWREISVNHSNIPIRTLKTKWENLRRSFRRQLQKIPKDASNAFMVSPFDVNNPWPHYRSMLFLVDRVRIAQVTTTPNENVTGSGSSSRKRSNVSKDYGGAWKKQRNEDVTENIAIKGSDSDVSAVNNLENGIVKTESAVTLNWEDYRDPRQLGDSDRFYLKSLLPYFERLDVGRKLLLRAKIEKLLREEFDV